MSNPLPCIALALRRARSQAGISQYELARLSGVARITIANIEGGKHPTMRTGTAQKLAKTLGIPPGDLLAGPSCESGAADEWATDQLLRRYQALKRGTVMRASAAEMGWLRTLLLHWRGSRPPTLTSTLFLLLALRHGEVDSVK